MSAEIPTKNLPSLEFSSGGFELFVPPTPFSQPPKQRPHFVMLDDKENLFYDIDYESPELRNTTPWTQLALHTVPDPAIVFPSNQYQMLELKKTMRVTGFLVSIRSRAQGVFTAFKIGTVHVQVLQQNFMNWGALESLKGRELPAEMKAGLLRRIFNRRPGTSTQRMSYVNPRSVLDKMPRKWHLNGDELNWELDSRFAGGARIGKEQKWKLHAL